MKRARVLWSEGIQVGSSGLVQALGIFPKRTNCDVSETVPADVSDYGHRIAEAISLGVAIEAVQQSSINRCEHEDPASVQSTVRVSRICCHDKVQQPVAIDVARARYGVAQSRARSITTDVEEDFSCQTRVQKHATGVVPAIDCC